MPCHFLVFSLRTPFCRDAVIQAPPFCRENLVSLYNLRGHDPTRVISRGMEIPLFQGNLGWWNIVIWPEWWWWSVRFFVSWGKMLDVRFLGTKYGSSYHTMESPERPLGVCFFIKPKASMYGIFAYIYPKNKPNVGKYTIHGWYGKGMG